MDKELKQVKEYYSEQYFNNEISTRIRDRVHVAINDSKVNRGKFTRIDVRNINRRIILSGVAVILLFGLFVGSAFVSPTMAEVASKIPYLNRIFQLKPIHESIREALNEKGYHVQGIGGPINGKKVIYIDIVGSEKYFNNVKKDIEKVAYSQLDARGYDAYKISVTRYVERKHEPHKMTEREVLANQVLRDSVEKLKEQNYNILQYGYGYSSPKSKKIEF
jgi:predicted RNA-binding protein